MKPVKTDTPRVGVEVAGDPITNHPVSDFRFHRMAGLARTLKRELAALEAKTASLWAEAEEAAKQLLAAEKRLSDAEAEAARLRLQNASLIEQRDRLVQTRTPDEEVDRLRAALDAAAVEAQQKDREIERLQAVVNEYESQWVDEHV